MTNSDLLFNPNPDNLIAESIQTKREQEFIRNHCRATDPETSVQAAESVAGTAKSTTAKLVKALLYKHMERQSLSKKEAKAIAGDSYRQRLSDARTYLAEHDIELGCIRFDRQSCWILDGDKDAIEELFKDMNC